MKRFITAAATAALFAAAAPAQAHFTHDKQIEVVFALDTTGSMTGLIEGAKAKIWSIATEIAQTHGNAEIRMGLIGFRDLGDNYVTQVYDLTSDLDDLYGDLLSFHADGGGDRPESVNQALDDAVNKVHWSYGDHTRRIVFLVGDSPPHMDYQHDVKYPKTLQVAGQRDIKVNTIQAGNASDTARVWRTIAQLGHGSYAAIPQDGNVVIYNSPYDHDIQQLQRKLHRTTVPYGRMEEREGFRAKMEQAASAPSSVASDRMAYRAAKQSAGADEGVVTGGGDLVDDVRSGKVKLGEVSAEELPTALRTMTTAEQEAYVERQARERSDIEVTLNKLVSQREAHIKAQRTADTASGKGDGFDEQVKQMVTEQLAE